jgi:protein tyrosine/serine phosphatase
MRPLINTHLTISKIAVALFLLCATVSAQEPADSSQLPRFHQVGERLFRGGQPREGGFAKLRDLGINTVINLRGASDRTRAEEKEVRALGLNYFNVPLPNWARPQHTRVARILELINAAESGRVFIHCKDGVDRTGMIVAIYRMKHDGWSADQALAEAERTGMRRTQFWMRDYTEDYGESLHKNGPQMVLKSPHVDEDFGDRIGNTMRFVERGTFRARKLAGRFFSKF